MNREGDKDRPARSDTPPTVGEVRELVELVWTDATHLADSNLQEELCEHLEKAAACLDAMFDAAGTGSEGAESGTDAEPVVPEKRFPIMGSHRSSEQNVGCPRDIPWSLVEPHRRQAHNNHMQTLEELAIRGGLSPSEMLALLEDRRWMHIEYCESVRRLVALVKFREEDRRVPS